jgi:hypothetical protein
MVLTMSGAFQQTSKKQAENARLLTRKLRMEIP